NAVRNIGGPLTGSFRVGFYLSESPRITTADQLIGARTNFSGLAAGEENSANSSVTLSADFLPGNYYLGAIADDLGAIPETDETNNSGTAVPVRIVVAEFVGIHLNGADVVVQFSAAPQKTFRLERT